MARKPSPLSPPLPRQSGTRRCCLAYGKFNFMVVVARRLRQQRVPLVRIEVCNVFKSDQRNGQRQPFVYRHVRRVKAAGGRGRRCGDGGAAETAAAAAAARRWDCYCCSRSKLPTPGDSTVYQATDVAGSARRLGDPSQSLTHLSRCFGAEPRVGAK